MSLSDENLQAATGIELGDLLTTDGDTAFLDWGVVNDLMNAVRAEERARAGAITPAMIQAAQDRVQGPDEDMYTAIYRAMRGAATQPQEGGQ